MSVFTWTPEFKAVREDKPNVKVLKFSDGYEQRQAEGLNYQPRRYSLAFSQRTVSEIDDIAYFLTARGATESFEWTPPRESTSARFVCRSWRRTYENASYDSLTAEFEEIFEP